MVCTVILGITKDTHTEIIHLISHQCKLGRKWSRSKKVEQVKESGSRSKKVEQVKAHFSAVEDLHNSLHKAVKDTVECRLGFAS